MTTPFLDIHTHKGNLLATAKETNSAQNSTAITHCIHNLSAEELLNFTSNPSSANAYSAGIHPWYAHAATIKRDLAQLEKVAKSPAIRLIGECGLDKLRGDFNLQMDILPPHFEIAIKEDKPLIFHCVRAYAELIALKKNILAKREHPLIIHGFDKNETLAAQLQQQGFYLSFGSALFRDNNKLTAALRQIHSQGIPFFLESDDSEKSIVDIYEHAANLLNITLDQLKDTIFASWKKIGLIHV